MSTATDRQQFREVLAGLATKTLTKIPALHGRVGKACKLVLGGDVALAEDGTAPVGSLTAPSRTYLVGHGACDCQDYDRAPEHLCAHRLSVGFLRKVQELLPASSSVETPAGIDLRHIVLIQNKPFVKFAGLLELAHKRGLQALRVDWTYNDAELSLAHAVTVFPFGTFEESGDATPANVNHKVAPHFRRCALTRAAARCLRLALGLDMVAVEELADE
jgi:hypothetical protein